MASVGRSQTFAPTIIAAPSGAVPGGVAPADANGVPPFYPSQVQQAYGLNLLQAGGGGSGAGQTVAIIDAYNYPNALATFNAFNSTFGLPLFNQGGGGPTFTQLNESGGATLPGTDPAGAGAASNWEYEEALDVEWVHSIAPLANIILYEAANPDSDGLPHLENAITTAKNNPAVSVVSMSWGGPEQVGQNSLDSLFTTPASRLALKKGVTFVAATGDSAVPGDYPAYSPNVVAVGGTSLALNSANGYSSETTWANSSGAGGSGPSVFEPKPAYQTKYGALNGGILSASLSRATPDVSMVADPATGVYVYDSFNGAAFTSDPNSWFFEFGGTSLSAQCWAGLIADADGIRSLAGDGTLDGPSQALPALYGLPSADFNDITTGSNGYAAGPGYDLATGIGTPVANLLVPDLANYQAVPEPSTAVLLGIAGIIVAGRGLRRRLLRQSR